MEKSNTEVRHTYTAADKERLLQSFLTSGQTIKQWCQEHRVGLSTLQRWRQDERVTTAVSPVQTWHRLLQFLRKQVLSPYKLAHST